MVSRWWCDVMWCDVSEDGRTVCMSMYMSYVCTYVPSPWQAWTRSRRTDLQCPVCSLVGWLVSCYLVSLVGWFLLTLKRRLKTMCHKSQATGIGRSIRNNQRPTTTNNQRRTTDLPAPKARSHCSISPSWPPRVWLTRDRNRAVDA